MVTADELLQELEQESQATRRVLERVPEDKLAWKPHEKSMTLGQLALHVATLPGRIAEVASRPSFDVRTAIPRPAPANVGELLEALEEGLAQARTFLGKMDESTLTARWTMLNGDREVMALPRAAFLRSVMFNHWYHHRGQLTVYLRLTGALVPATYGPSADENPMGI